MEKREQEFIDKMVLENIEDSDLEFIQEENVNIKSKKNKKEDVNKNDFIEKLKPCLKKFGKTLLNKLYHLVVGIVAIIIVFIFFVIFMNWSNDSLVVTEDIYIDNNLPGSFDGYKILQISDFNNKKDLSKKLIEKTKEINPDIIVITGDYINSDRCTEYNVDYSYLEAISNQYPVYFVTGEQEQDSLFYDKMKVKLETINIHILENEIIELSKGTDNICLMGVDDSSFFFENVAMMNEKIKENKKDEFTILLSHRPELIDVYTENNINLVVSGHALGGQIRLPFVGAFYSSNQGFYPDYTEGFYKQNNTTLYVSRGIGNTFIPFRIFNRPEINVITLKNR